MMIWLINWLWYEYNTVQNYWHEGTHSDIRARYCLTTEIKSKYQNVLYSLSSSLFVQYLAIFRAAVAAASAVRAWALANQARFW